MNLIISSALLPGLFILARFHYLALRHCHHSYTHTLLSALCQVGTFISWHRKKRKLWRHLITEHIVSSTPSQCLITLFRLTKPLIFSGLIISYQLWLQGAWMHYETYAAKGEFGEFTLARGRKLHSYFAKHHTCMSVTQCWGALEVLLSMFGALEMVQTLTFNFKIVYLSNA